jgi:SSS family transporter
MHTKTLAATIVSLIACAVAVAQPATHLVTEDLPPLPAPRSGHFAGVHNDALIVAGGSNFEVSPFQGGEKLWFETVYVLEPGADDWIEAGNLPAPRAYGGMVSHASGVYLIGGTNGDHHYDDVLRLTWENDSLDISPVDAPLPEPLAMTGSAIIGDTAYLVGGETAPGVTTAQKAFLALDLTNIAQGWKSLSPWPGPARILPAVCATDSELFVVSGAELIAKDDGTPGRVYHADTFVYTPGSGWRTGTGPDQPMVAAAAAPLGHSQIVVFGGDHGRLADQTQTLGDDHPGFDSPAQIYNAVTDTWYKPEAPLPAVVTVPAVRWQGAVVVPAGEDRPGHRATTVRAYRTESARGTLTTLDYVAIVLYFAVLVGMGTWFARREKSTEQFFLGGRNVPWWAVGLSIFGTSLSAITYLSVPARAFATDWTFALANTAPIFLAPFIVYYYLPHFQRSPISTAYEYLEKRFNVLVRIYGSACFFIFQIGRVGIVMLLPAIALSAATGLDKYQCILAMGVLATIYTYMGGIEAVIWTDVIQAIVLVAGAIFALVAISLSLDGGLSGAFAEAATFDKTRIADLSWDPTSAVLWVVLVGNIFSNLYPLTADQTVVQRYLTTKNTKAAGRAVWTNALLGMPMTILFFTLGTALWAWFRQHPEMLDPQLENDAILPLFITAEFPVGLRGVIIAGIFAAAMSSLDSSINSVASVLVNDYYRRFGRNVTEKKALFMAKTLTLVFGLFGTLSALYVASLNETTLWEPFLKLLGLVGSGLAGVVALGVFTKRANGIGAMTGALFSAAVLYYVKGTSMHFFLQAPVGFIAAFAVGYAVSLVTPGRSDAGT